METLVPGVGQEKLIEKKPGYICPKCQGKRWKTKSKRDKVKIAFQCRKCGYMQTKKEDGSYVEYVIPK